MRSFVMTAAAAGVGYLWRNRQSLRARASRLSSSTSTPDRGVTIYDNHPTAE